MKKILVPTDFSHNANKALDFAVQVAKQAKAEILLIHACNLIDTTFKDHLALKKEHNERVLDNANKNLEALKNSIADTEQIDVIIKVYSGDVTGSILKAAEANEVDMIIIGTRGETNFTEKIFGGTTSDLLGKSKVPVMVISPLTEWETTLNQPGEITIHDSGEFTPDAMLFATNQFERNTELLKPVVDVARLFSLKVHVAVFVDKHFADAFDYLYNIEELNRYIDFLKRTYHDVDFKGELLEGEEFESTLEKYNDVNGVDIIAMITYPKSFWQRLMKKSMTKEVALKSKVPVIGIIGK